MFVIKEINVKHSSGLLILAALMLAGCEVPKDALPIGGSRADGTVVLGYTLHEMEIARVDWVAAQKNADKRCQAWGYRRADAFEGEARSYAGPSIFQVSKTYQCVN
ncbi:YecR family lipoprotein [Pontitalea aquivivens]|uniref:YecR family lipoprotein n=1 Tax=Pontitalea aquivivens TaxID=3388663 RepID=UPI003970FE86